MIGLDLSFCFENMISADVEKAVTENKEQIIEGIKFRGAVSAYRFFYDKYCTPTFIPKDFISQFTINWFVMTNIYDRALSRPMLL